MANTDIDTIVTILSEVREYVPEAAVTPCYIDYITLERWNRIPKHIRDDIECVGVYDEELHRIEL